MENKTKIESIILIASLVILTIISGVYFWLQNTYINNLATFLSGVSTVGIFILTAFYVIYTNRQLREIQKQRQLNIQPLPNLNIIHGVILSPRVVYDPTEGGEISLVVDFCFKAKLKNIGNGAGVLVDTFSYFTGRDITPIKDHFYSERYITLEEKEEVESNFSVRDANFEVINSLNKGVDGPCPREQIFDAMLKCCVLYKNILGAGFHYSIHNALIIDEEGQKKLSEWIAHINSFSKKYNSSIEKFKATFKRDREEAYKYFEEIKNEFYSYCEIHAIDLYVRSLPQSFSINYINDKTYESISKEIYHGVPIGRLDMEDHDKIAVDKWKDELLMDNFGKKTSTNNTSANDTTATNQN